MLILGRIQVLLKLRRGKLLILKVRDDNQNLKLFMKVKTSLILNNVQVIYKFTEIKSMPLMTKMKQKNFIKIKTRKKKP